MEKERESCVKSARGPILSLDKQAAAPGSNGHEVKEVSKMIARVGKPAPDFEANAYIDGGFKTLSLSDFKGKWIIICFYPGDFTFV